MTTKEKCEAIIKRILAITDETEDGISITFSRDWGGNSITVIRSDRGHTHCGQDDGTFGHLVDSLLSTLSDGPGLSWACGPEQTKGDK